MLGQPVQTGAGNAAAGCAVDEHVTDTVCPAVPGSVSQGICTSGTSASSAAAARSSRPGLGVHPCSIAYPAPPGASSSCSFTADGYDEFSVTAAGAWYVRVQHGDDVRAYSAGQLTNCFGSGAAGTEGNHLILFCTRIQPGDVVTASIDGPGSITFTSVCSVDPLCWPVEPARG